MRNIREVGKYRRAQFRWLPADIDPIETQEFSDEIQGYSAFEYLTLWVQRMGDGYEIVKKSRNGVFHYTIIENQE